MTRTNSLQIQYVEEQYETLTSLGKEGGQTFLAKEKRNGRIVVKKYVTAEAALLYEKLRGIKSSHLAEIYELMKLESFHELFIRSMDDIASSPAEQLAFVRYADDHDVKIHIIDVTPETDGEIWDGGIGC